jgi:hypothetical protein
MPRARPAADGLCRPGHRRASITRQGTAVAPYHTSGPGIRPAQLVRRSRRRVAMVDCRFSGRGGADGGGTDALGAGGERSVAGGDALLRRQGGAAHACPGAGPGRQLARGGGPARRDGPANASRLGAPLQRVWTAPALQGCSSDMVGIIGSGCSRVSGLSRGLIAAGLDGRSASRAPIAEANSRFVL